VNFCGDARSDIARGESTGIREETKQETLHAQSNYRVLGKDQCPVDRWGRRARKPGERSLKDSVNPLEPGGDRRKAVQFTSHYILIGDQEDSRTLLKNGRSHNNFVDAITHVAREWKRTGEGWGDGVEHMHGVMIAFQHEIHFKFFLGDIE